MWHNHTFHRLAKTELDLRSLTPGKLVMAGIDQLDMGSLAKSKSPKMPVNSQFSSDFPKRLLMATSNSGIWISGTFTMVDMKSSSIPNTGKVTAMTPTPSSLLLKNSTPTNILNLFTGQAFKRNILASSHRCTKEQNHLEQTTIEQFRRHHMSTQTQSLPSDSRMAESSRSEVAVNIIELQQRDEFKLESNIVMLVSWKVSTISVFVLYILF